MRTGSKRAMKKNASEGKSNLKLLAKTRPQGEDRAGHYCLRLVVVPIIQFLV